MIRQWLPLEVWRELRPFLKILLVEVSRQAGLWIALFAFERLTHILNVEGWAGTFMKAVHEFGTALVFTILQMRFVREVSDLQKKEPKGKGRPKKPSQARRRRASWRKRS